MKLLIVYDDGRTEVRSNIRIIEETYGQQIELIAYNTGANLEQLADVATIQVLEVENHN